MNPAVDAQAHRLGSTVPLCRGRDALDLDDAVDHDGTDPGSDGTVDLGKTLVVAVEAEPRRLNPCGQGDRHLAATGDVDVEALLGNPAGDLGAQKRLARVVDLRGAPDPGELAVERGADGVGAGAGIRLVNNVDGRAKLGRNG